MRLSLEIDLEARPIQGTLVPPDTPPIPFVGWLGLTVALDGLRSPPEATEDEE